MDTNAAGDPGDAAGAELNRAYAGREFLEHMEEARNYADAIFAMLQSSAAGARTILDFGGGSGSFARKFAETGVTVDSVEADEELRWRLAEVCGRAFADLGTVADAAYDFVYTVNVLEHIADDRAACRDIRRVLRPGGRVFVFVPAFPILWTSLDDAVEHERRYAWSGLGRVLSDAGFEIEEIRYFDALGFPAALGVRLMESAGLFSYNRQSIGFYDRYLFPVSRGADRILGRAFGKNLVVRARRPAA